MYMKHRMATSIPILAYIQKEVQSNSPKPMQVINFVAAGNKKSILEINHNETTKSLLSQHIKIFSVELHQFFYLQNRR